MKKTNEFDLAAEKTYQILSLLDGLSTVVIKIIIDKIQNEVQTASLKFNSQK